MLMFKHILLLFMIVIVLGGCSTAPQQTAQAVSSGEAVAAQPAKLLSGDGDIPKAGDVAPDFQFTMPDGTNTKLSALHGKKVILNFWATWCGPCQMEMPALEQAHQHSNNLVVLGMNREGVGVQPTIDAVQSFTKDVRVTFPIMLDLDSAIADRYGVHNLPMSFFINTDGTISNIHLGGMDYDFISQQVDQLK